MIIATAIAGPIAAGSFRFWSIWISPISVPTMPNAGAYIPALFMNLTRSDGPAAASPIWTRIAASSAVSAVRAVDRHLDRPSGGLGSSISSMRRVERERAVAAGRAGKVDDLGGERRVVGHLEAEEVLHQRHEPLDLADGERHQQARDRPAEHDQQRLRVEERDPAVAHKDGAEDEADAGDEADGG